MNFNDDVPVSLGVSKERSKVIQGYVTGIINSQHSDPERLERIKASFPRFEECIYAVYLLVPTKLAIAGEESPDAGVSGN